MLSFSLSLVFTPPNVKCLRKNYDDYSCTEAIKRIAMCSARGAEPSKYKFITLTVIALAFTLDCVTPTPVCNDKIKMEALFNYFDINLSFILKEKKYDTKNCHNKR